jgi:subtilase family serine protease
LWSFAPTAEEAKTVQEFFESHNLRVVKVGRDNFFVRARGTVGDVQNAFHVQLNDYQVRAKVIRANATDPYVEGAAGALVRAVSGLDSGEYEHPAMQRGAKFPAGKSGNMTTAAASSSSFYSSDCFDGVVTQTYSRNNDVRLPIGTYTGNHLNLQSLTSAGCGYTPKPIQAYNLAGLYAEGYTGKGQTSSSSTGAGPQPFRKMRTSFLRSLDYHSLGPSNFSIIYTPTASSCEAADSVEINIDVEWAHAIAPGAKIDLVVPPSASFQDVDQAVFYAVNDGLGNVLSGSYGSPEPETPQSVLDTENLTAKTAAILGISTNFSSGDDGDFTPDGIPATVSAPADSPWTTGVGEVTLALNADNSIAWQSGWGNNESELAFEGCVPNPPVDFGFIGGAGGGPSNCAVQDSSGNWPVSRNLHFKGLSLESVGRFPISHGWRIPTLEW